jgi:hypothetical protein
VAPHAVGHHVDHQIAHAAARAVEGAELTFYEDTPYVLTRYQLGRRLARLGLGVDVLDATLARGTVKAELRAAARAWLDAPMIQAMVGPRLRKVAVATILPPELLRWPRRSRAPTGRAEPLLVDGGALALDARAFAELKLQAVACYPSQWRLFYPSLADWRAALEAYAAQMGRAGVVERAWRVRYPT